MSKTTAIHNCDLSLLHQQCVSWDKDPRNRVLINLIHFIFQVNLCMDGSLRVVFWSLNSSGLLFSWDLAIYFGCQNLKVSTDYVASMLSLSLSSNLGL
ncbi:hypothetical protein QYF36_014723 [Acer negundo]|nr:hypothetical protein QYF36_014723 [Acer negundo]